MTKSDYLIDEENTVPITSMVKLSRVLLIFTMKIGNETKWWRVSNYPSTCHHTHTGMPSPSRRVKCDSWVFLSPVASYAKRFLLHDANWTNKTSAVAFVWLRFVRYTLNSLNLIFICCKYIYMEITLHIWHRVRTTNPQWNCMNSNSNCVTNV